MKVVLFCGGLGMRMRDGIHSGPKPMAMIGDRPLLWHVMRYYAHFGHTDFFLNYDETRSNDFVLEGGDREVKLFRTDISDWRITFVDTGLNSAIGERLGRGPRGGPPGSSTGSRCSWPTTRTSSPTRRCRT